MQWTEQKVKAQAIHRWSWASQSVYHTPPTVLQVHAQPAGHPGHTKSSNYQKDFCGKLIFQKAKNYGQVERGWQLSACHRESGVTFFCIGWQELSIAMRYKGRSGGGLLLWSMHTWVECNGDTDIGCTVGP